MKNAKQMWNIIRKSKKAKSPTSAITTKKLEDHFSAKFRIPDTSSETIIAEDHFSAKFRIPDTSSETIIAACSNVELKYQACRENVYSDFVLTVNQMKKYIMQMKLGCAPGFDGICPEHVIYGINTRLPVLISHLLTVCIQYVIVPDRFSNGLLIVTRLLIKLLASYSVCDFIQAIGVSYAGIICNTSIQFCPIWIYS